MPAGSRHRNAAGAALGLLALMSSAALAEESSIWPMPDYRGDVRSRRALLGDFGGARTRLAERGVTLSIDVLQTYQGVVDGGSKRRDAYDGSIDYELHVDTGRLGLWPGGFLRLFAESQFGDSINRDTGAILAANTDALFPLPDQGLTTLTSVSYTQFLAEWLALIVGKLETFDGDTNAFASARGKTQFSNLALVANPVALRSTPYTALGGAVLFVLPEQRGTFTVSALDALGQPDVSGFDDAFDEGTVIAEELRIAVRPFGLAGHQLLGGNWSSRDFTVLDQDRRLILTRLIGLNDVTLERATATWCVYYNFDQYLFTEDDDPAQGVGLFFRFGMGAEPTNPLARFYSFGLGGTGIVPTRDHDTFGVGFYRLDASDDIPRRVRDRLQSGEGFEAFYNVEAAPWLHLTPDLQLIEPSQRQVDTAVVVGVRVKIDL